MVNIIFNSIRLGEVRGFGFWRNTNGENSENIVVVVFFHVCGFTAWWRLLTDCCPVSAHWCLQCYHYLKYKKYLILYFQFPTLCFIWTHTGLFFWKSCPEVSCVVAGGSTAGGAFTYHRQHCSLWMNRAGPACTWTARFTAQGPKRRPVAPWGPPKGPTGVARLTAVWPLFPDFIFHTTLTVILTWVILIMSLSVVRVCSRGH